MKPTLIIPIDIADDISENGHRFILKIHNLNKLESAIKIANKAEGCSGIICDFRDIDLSDLLDTQIKSKVNVIINCSSDGEIYNLLKSVPDFEKRNIEANWVYLLLPNTKNAVTVMKILSSYGYRVGFQYFKAHKIDENDFVELATYSYLSPAPHAPIEPFGYILEEVRKKSRAIDLDDYYFNAPGKYLYISENGQIALNEDDLLNGNFICDNVNELGSLNIEELYHNHKNKKFYSHFSKEDDCSKCQCMKICSGYFNNHFPDCSTVMDEIYEMISICLQ